MTNTYFQEIPVFQDLKNSEVVLHTEVPGYMAFETCAMDIAKILDKHKIPYCKQVDLSIHHVTPFPFLKFPSLVIKKKTSQETVVSHHLYLGSAGVMELLLVNDVFDTQSLKTCYDLGEEFFGMQANCEDDYVWFIGDGVTDKAVTVFDVVDQFTELLDRFLIKGNQTQSQQPQ